jgi:uncharacterized membrane protein YjjP (DUF1212 family)
MHEISHYKQLSKTNRTIILAKQTRNYDYDEYINIQRIQIMIQKKKLMIEKNESVLNFENEIYI